MLRRLLLVLGASGALVFATCGPARCQEPEFVPGTPAAAKFAWGKQNFGRFCRAPMPDIRFGDLPYAAVAYIETLSKRDVGNLIRQHCNTPPDLVAYSN